MFDASFIVFLGFVCFMFLTLKYGYRKSINTLDSQIANVKKIIDDAESAVSEAENKLRQETQNKDLLIKDIEDLVDKTTHQINQMKQNYELELTKLLESKNELADSMKDQLRLKVIQEIKILLSDKIETILTNLMTHNLSPELHETINEDAINQLESTIQNTDEHMGFIGHSPKKMAYSA